MSVRKKSSMAEAAAAAPASAAGGGGLKSFLAYMYQDANGPRAKIWLASHMLKSLKKGEITSLNVAAEAKKFQSDPKLKSATMRQWGQLVLGLTRIYGKKVDFMKKDVDNLSHRLLATKVTDEFDEGDLGTIASGDNKTPHKVGRRSHGPTILPDQELQGKQINLLEPLLPEFDFLDQPLDDDPLFDGKIDDLDSIISDLGPKGSIEQTPIDLDMIDPNGEIEVDDIPLFDDDLLGKDNKSITSIDEPSIVEGEVRRIEQEVDVLGKDDSLLSLGGGDYQDDGFGDAAPGHADDASRQSVADIDDAIDKLAEELHKTKKKKAPPRKPRQPNAYVPVIDDYTEIPSLEMKGWIEDTEDIQVQPGRRPRLPERKGLSGQLTAFRDELPERADGRSNQLFHLPGIGYGHRFRSELGQLSQLSLLRTDVGEFPPKFQRFYQSLLTVTPIDDDNSVEGVDESIQHDEQPNLGDFGEDLGQIDGGMGEFGQQIDETQAPLTPADGERKTDEEIEFDIPPEQQEPQPEEEERLPEEEELIPELERDEEDLIYQQKHRQSQQFWGELPNADDAASEAAASGWSKRSQVMYDKLAPKLAGGKTVDYNQVIPKNNRQIAGTGFYQLLLLASQDYIKLAQPAATAENDHNPPILISAGRQKPSPQVANGRASKGRASTSATAQPATNDTSTSASKKPATAKRASNGVLAPTNAPAKKQKKLTKKQQEEQEMMDEEEDIQEERKEQPMDPDTQMSEEY